MSQLIFPTLQGLAWGVQRSVLAPEVQIRTTPSQREFRARNAVLPRYAYTLVYEFLRAGAQAELQQLVGFYNQVGGPFDSFLFKDPDDCQVSLQPVGVGDGQTKSFQLLRTFGGFAEPLYDIEGTTFVGVAGASTPGRTVGATGVLTFDVAPANGAAITWSGTYFRRVRFDGARLDTTKFAAQLHEAKSVKLISVKA